VEFKECLLINQQNSVPKSHDSSVGTALGYGLDDRGSRVRFQAGAGNFSLHHRVQNGSGAHPVFYPMGTSGRGVKLIIHLHLVPRSKNDWSYTFTPPIRLHGVVLSKAQGQLYLYLYSLPYPEPLKSLLQFTTYFQETHFNV
jgi:hypothetical protein